MELLSLLGPEVQISGFYGTGMLFMAVWYWNFPNEDAIEPVLKPRGSEDRKKVMQRRSPPAPADRTQCSRGHQAVYVAFWGVSSPCAWCQLEIPRRLLISCCAQVSRLPSSSSACGSC